MSTGHVLPELKEIVGAMLFVYKEPLTAGEIRKVLVQVGEGRTDAMKDYAKASEKDVLAALEQLTVDLIERHTGICVTEIAGGFRLENEGNCGPWLRRLLQKGRPNRLSRPALETLAIIAYRQPAVRSEIEAVRGVAVDQILRNLIEMQLIRIVGRSELPGRPWQFGTTTKFLEHFGLKSLNDLPGTEELRRMESAQLKKPAPQEPPPGQTPAAPPPAPAAGESAVPGIEEALDDPNRNKDLKPEADSIAEETGAEEVEEEGEDEEDEEDEDENEDEDEEED